MQELFTVVLYCTVPCVGHFCDTCKRRFISREGLPMKLLLPLLGTLLLLTEGFAPGLSPRHAASRSRATVVTLGEGDEKLDDEKKDMDFGTLVGDDKVGDGKDVEMKGIFDFEAMGKGIWGNGIGNLAWSPNKVAAKWFPGKKDEPEQPPDNDK